VVEYTSIMKIFKKQKPYIRFVSTIEGLENIEELAPKLATKYMPDWFKNFPISKTTRTVRDCPSFPDFFSSAYVVPMWQDSILSYDKKTNMWNALSGTITSWEFHTNEQFIDNVKASFQGVDSDFIFKANCPWRIITPPGYSVLQLPMFYHFNKDWSVLPGIIDTDIHHQINQQLMYHGNGDQVKIAKGTPLAMYLPFERKKINLSVDSPTDEEKKIFNINDLNIQSIIFSKGYYRKLQKNRDKN
jgi:hypothetical protein